MAFVVDPRFHPDYPGEQPEGDGSLFREIAARTRGVDYHPPTGQLGSYGRGPLGEPTFEPFHPAYVDWLVKNSPEVDFASRRQLRAAEDSRVSQPLSRAAAGNAHPELLATSTHHPKGGTGPSQPARGETAEGISNALAATKKMTDLGARGAVAVTRARPGGKALADRAEKRVFGPTGNALLAGEHVAGIVSDAQKGKPADQIAVDHSAHIAADLAADATADKAGNAAGIVARRGAARLLGREIGAVAAGGPFDPLVATAASLVLGELFANGANKAVPAYQRIKKAADALHRLMTEGTGSPVSLGPYIPPH